MPRETAPIARARARTPGTPSCAQAQATTKIGSSALDSFDSSAANPARAARAVRRWSAAHVAATQNVAAIRSLRAAIHTTASDESGCRPKSSAAIAPRVSPCRLLTSPPTSPVHARCQSKLWKCAHPGTNPNSVTSA